jgi:hypothetical protein
MKTDFLHSFIQAMDEGEIRYCRRQMLQNEAQVEKGYITMTDAIRSMPSYDSEALKASIKGYPVASHLAVEKTRLYGVLLSHMKVLRDSRKPINDPKKRLEEAMLLADMNLPEAAIEAAQKGLEVAIQREDLIHEVALRDLMRNIQKAMAQKNLIKERTENEYALVMTARKLARLMRYKQINDRMYDYLRSYRVSDSDAVHRGIDELMQLPEMADGNMADSLPSQIRYYATRQLYYSQRNEKEKSIDMSVRLIKLWEQNPELIKLDPLDYITIVSNVVGKLALIGKTDEAFGYLQKLESTMVRGRRNMVKHFGYVELQYQVFHLNQADADKVIAREALVNAGLKRYHTNIQNSSHLAILYNLGVAHLLLNHTGKATGYFDRVRQLGKLPERQDLQGIGRLLRLLLLSEKEGNVNFDYYLRNSHRFFGKTDRGYSLENIVYDWLKPHSKLDGPKDQKQSLKTFADMVEPLMSKRLLGAEEMWVWATAKYNDELPLSVFRRRLNK